MKSKLKQKLEEQQLKQCDLAKSTKIGISSISCYVNGYSEPAYENACRIAQALDCGLTDLWPNRRWN